MLANISYGNGLPGDAELRLCGDLSDGRRAVELGVSDWFNSIAFAAIGAKAIAVDPDPQRTGEMRTRAAAAELSVQCYDGDLADLGEITSGTIDVVVAAHTLEEVDDLSRLLRQVHRILKPSLPFVISMTHPFASVAEGNAYGSDHRSISDWFTALSRSNFRVDQVRELGVAADGLAPSTLVLRARKEGS